MKTFSRFMLTMLCAVAMISCNNTANNQQQSAAPAEQQQSAVATSASQQPAPAQAQVQPQDLPQEITAFINKHFPGATIAGVEPDNEFGGVEYDIHLNDGTEVDFDKNNQWEQVDCKGKAVPAALIPTNIANYVKTNYQAVAIAKIDKKNYSGYEIELANGMELKFDASGKFVGIDN